MKSEIKKLDKSIVEITLEETKENIAKYRKKVISNLQKTADIKGFRKGANIPEEVILKHYQEEYINSLVIDEALNKIYIQALKTHNLMPISQGELSQIVSQDPLIVKMKVEVFPDIDIKKDYKKIKLKKSKVKITKKEVDENLDSIKKKFTKFEKANSTYKIKSGDKVVINTMGYDLDGNALENTNMQEYPLVIGSNILVPGFEEQLIGKKSGEKIKIDVEFPKDYHNNDFAGKQTKFDVEIIEIQKAVIPEFTPEFIKDLRGKDLDLEGFKKLIEEEIKETKEQNARLEDENKLMDELIKITKVDLGDNLVKNQIEKVFAEVKENITQSGAKVSDYIASLGLDEETYKDTQIKPIAEKRLLSELILHRLLEMEKVEVSKEELEQEIQKILERFGSDDVVGRLKELYVPGTKYYEELEQRIKYRNLIDSFFTTE